MRRSTILMAVLLIVTELAAANWEKGVAAFRNGDFQSAALEFQALVDQQESFQGHYMLGLSLNRLNRKEEALTHLRKAYDLNPSELSVKLALADAFVNGRSYGEAAKLLGTVESAEIDKLDATRKKAFYQMRAISREESGDITGAYGDYGELARLLTQDSKVQFKYAVLAANHGDDRAALTAIDRANNLDPDNQQIKRSYIAILKKQGRLTQDKSAKNQTYLKAVNLAKQLVAFAASFENVLLKCEVELGATLYAEATKTCQQAVSKKPDDWLAHYYLGHAYASNQQYKEAEAPLEQALKLARPADRDTIQKQRGFVFERQNKFSESIASYDAAGDQNSVARVRKNQATFSENQEIKQQNAEIERMREEAEALEAELEKLEKGGGGR